MNYRVKVCGIKFVVFSFFLLAINTANAAPMTFRYTGEVRTIFSDETGQLAAAGIESGAQFFGEFSYDSEASSNGNFDGGANFPGLSINIEFTSGINASSTGIPIVQMYDDHSSFNDGLNMLAGPSGSSSSFFDYDIHLQIQVIFLNSLAALYSSVQPPTSLEYSDFDYHRFVFSGRDSVGFDRFDGQILSVRQVPEPSVLLLFIVGALAICCTKSANKS